MRKLIIGTVATTTLFFAGAGAAFAAVSGSLNVSTSGAATSGGTFNFKSAGCKWGTNAWDGRVSGVFDVSTATDHLNGRVDGYGWTKLVQANSAGDYDYDYCISGRDVTVHDTIAIQACREHWYGDDCSSKEKSRT
ncbi:hypothetical protein [Nocardioides conyzicola]|uniref:Secreted protein n=1 Tax=Nocardioides conyzicola TaxID=1651781 RepID=A0ABP8XA22_9ACTN